MTSLDNGGSGNNPDLPITPLPKTAVQALYHAVTGKTENLSKPLNGRVIIRSSDIDRLYEILIDQLNLHHIISGPTVTIVLKGEAGKKTTYSSWERYKALRVGNHEITSEFNIKFEFLIQLPATTSPQRCIISISMDSALSFLSDPEQRKRMELIPTFLLVERDWETVTTSIDFVDFLVAKSFMSIIDEWFSTLDKCPDNKLNNFILRHLELIRSPLTQSGRLGMATFMFAYSYFTIERNIDIRGFVFAGAIGLAIWAIFIVTESSIFKIISSRTIANVIPSVILITDGDVKAYQTIMHQLNSTGKTIMGYTATIIGSIILNISSSAVYARFFS